MRFVRILALLCGIATGVLGVASLVAAVYGPKQEMRVYTRSGAEFHSVIEFGGTVGNFLIVGMIAALVVGVAAIVYAFRLKWPGRIGIWVGSLCLWFITLQLATYRPGAYEFAFPIGTTLSLIASACALLAVIMSIVPPALFGTRGSAGSLTQQEG